VAESFSLFSKKFNSNDTIGMELKGKIQSALNPTDADTHHSGLKTYPFGNRMTGKLNMGITPTVVKLTVEKGKEAKMNGAYLRNGDAKYVFRPVQTFLWNGTFSITPIKKDKKPDVMGTGNLEVTGSMKV